MRVLFNLDNKDYDLNWRIVDRPSVRGIIIKDNKIAMGYSQKHDYYQFPGGGVEHGESHLQTLKREVKEEVGLIVIDESVREYGLVHKIQKGHGRYIWIQENFYYTCDVEKKIEEQNLDKRERKEGLKLEFVNAKHAINTNREKKHGVREALMLEREARVLEFLIREGYLN